MRIYDEMIQTKIILHVSKITLRNTRYYKVAQCWTCVAQYFSGSREMLRRVCPKLIDADHFDCLSQSQTIFRELLNNSSQNPWIHFQLKIIKIKLFPIEIITFWRFLTIRTLSFVNFGV